MSVSPTAIPDDIDLAAVARATARNIPKLLIVAALVGAATAAILSTMASKYLSQAQLEIRSTGAADAGGRPDKEAVGTHVRGLMSTELALKMAGALQLTKQPEFNSALEPDDIYGRTLRKIGIGGPKASETDEDRLMQAYFKAVRAYQVRDTRSVIIDCTTSNAKFSADCANKLAELYRDSLSGRARTENEDMRGKLAPQVERLTREVAEAEAQATEFRGKANLFQGGAQATQLKEQQLGELTAELTRAATARGDAEARAASAREMGARGMAASNPDVQKSTLIPRLEEARVTLERQISELSATLLPAHPRMKQLTSELAGLQSQIRAEVQKVVESLSNDARIAADREAGTRRRIDEMKRTVVSSAPDSAKLAQIENQAKSKRIELERLQRQFEAAASVAGAGVGPTEVEIVSRAYASNEKVFPKIGSMAPLAVLATFILGIALILTRELMRGARSGTVQSSNNQSAPGRRDVPPSLAPAPIAAVKTAPVPKSQPAQAAALEASALLAPAEAAAVIMYASKGARGFRVLVAGTSDQIDATAAAAAVSRSLDVDGRAVALLGWDGSGDTLAHVAGLELAPGVTELLAGDASLEEATQKLPGTHIHVITAGNGSAGTIDADSAAMVLDALDEMYDVIVVTGTTRVATGLFAALQGRFDAGILVSDTVPARASGGAGVPFLGFDVPEFVVTVVRHVDSPSSAPSVRSRLAQRRSTMTANGST